MSSNKRKLLQHENIDDSDYGFSSDEFEHISEIILECEPVVAPKSTLSQGNHTGLNYYEAAGIPSPKKPRLTVTGECHNENNSSTDPTVPYCIAYCPRVVQMMQEMNLPTGFCYELAVLISSGKTKYADITEQKLNGVQGKNNAFAAPQVNRIFGNEKPENIQVKGQVNTSYFSNENLATVPWKELDREEAALLRGPYEGLGNNDSEPGWYGGKVEFRAHLKSKAKIKGYAHELVLESCSLGTSSRFTRRFGSWSFIRVKIPKDVLHDADSRLQTFFKKPFILWGKVFRTCYAKRDNIFLYWTDETYPLTSPSKVSNRLSLEQFIAWHNPIEMNSKQLMTKWSSRTTLGFSNSVPGPRICREHIEEISDVVSEKESIMTDGCGLATKGLSLSLVNQLSLLNLPSALQFRLGGYKGLLLMALPQVDQHHEIKVRPSQIKIRYPADVALDPAMLTIDLIRTSRLTSPSRIAADMIINLSENGVPPEAFVNLLHLTIREFFDGLTTWEGPNAMYNLWVNVERAGGVLNGRRARETAGEARVLGYTNRSPDDIDLEDLDDEDDGTEDGLGVSQPKSVAWWPDHISGCPSTLEETVLVLLDSGFRPQDSPILREKLKQVVASKVDHKLRKIRLEVKGSCVAFAVPDPYGVLEENEIQVKSSKRIFETEDGIPTDIILGDVLIGRNPCKVPSDVRKVKAVEHPQLRTFMDVIVFSIKGLRRLIDFLGGGDYDGDTALVIFCKCLVEHFLNADEKYSVEPPGLEMAFTRDTETGAAFIERTKDLGSSERVHAIQDYLLGGLIDPSLLGRYTALHNNAIYKYGYGHWRTHNLAAKCVRLLDSEKTGYRIKKKTKIEDFKEYGHELGPQWQAINKEKNKDRKNSGNKYSQVNSTFLQRNCSSSYVKGEFIMDTLRMAADEEKTRLMTRIDQIFAPLHNEPDADLIAPWEAAVQWAERPGTSKESMKSKKKALSLICIHVRDMYKKHKDTLKSNQAEKASQTEAGVAFTNLPIQRRQDQLRELSKAFVSKPLLEEVPDIPDQETLDRWRASYAYKYDAEQNLWNGEQGFSRFPWNVALRELCAIKARSLGPSKTVTNNFYERFKLVPPR